MADCGTILCALNLYIYTLQDCTDVRDIQVIWIFVRVPGSTRWQFSISWPWRWQRLQYVWDLVRRHPNFWIHVLFFAENETAVIRWNYGDPKLGTCKETISGGNHFRYWVQNGPNTNRWLTILFVNRTLLLNSASNSGAVFMAASYEKPIARKFLLVRILLCSDLAL